jgi:hypothetical protein
MKKYLILILIIIVTIASLHAVVHYFRMDSFLFAWVLNFLLMASVQIFVETLKGPLNSASFKEKGWERGGKIYEKVGVNFFRKVLVWVGWEKLNKKLNPVEKNTKALLHLYDQTKKSELGHFIILLIVIGFDVYVAFEFGIAKSFWLLGLNILLNLYPIFLQRYNRPRIERAIILSRRR